RRDKPELRPPHTYVAFQEWSRRPEIAAKNNLVVARPLTDATQATNAAIRLEHLQANQTAAFKQHAAESHKMRDERIKWEEKLPHEKPKVGDVRPPTRQTVPQSPVFKPPTDRTKVLPAPKQPLVPQPTRPQGEIKPPMNLPNPEEIL